MLKKISQNCLAEICEKKIALLSEIEDFLMVYNLLVILVSFLDFDGNNKNK